MASSRKLLSLMVVFAAFSSSWAKTPSTNQKSVANAIEDPYNLNEWQNNTKWFGDSFFGLLNTKPLERRKALQELLYIYKDAMGRKGKPSTQLTQQLLTGYFVASPSYLKSPEGQATTFIVGAAIEAELKRHVIDNFHHCKERNETCFYGKNITQMQQSYWLMERVDWKRIIVTILIGQPYERFAPKGVNQQCYLDSVHMLRSFYMQETWAIEMLDASGKLPVGLFQGNLNWIGQYDQCNLITTNHTRSLNNDSVGGFTGSYCDIKMDIPEGINVPKAPGQNLSLRMGVCFPSTCHANDVKLIMGNLKVLGQSLPKITYARCHADSPGASGEFARDRTAHFAAVFMAILVVLVVAATLIDGFLWYEAEDAPAPKPTPAAASHSASTSKLNGSVNEAYSKGEEVELTEVKLDLTQNGHSNGGVGNGIATERKGQINGKETPIKLEAFKPPPDRILKRVIKAYSIYSNLPALLSTDQPRGALKSLDAMRVFNMNWIILGHVYSIGAVFMPETMANAKLAAEQIKDPTFMGVYSAMLGVDSYFFISGLLVSYLFLKSSAKNHGRWGMQLLVYYIHRFWRIIPLYAILVLVYAAFGKYLGSGPLFDWQSARVRDCNNNWWASLLFINNFYKPREMCLGWSWYLSNDMQFYILAPTMLIPLFLSPVIGVCCVSVYFIIHWVTTAVLWRATQGKSYMQDPDIFYEAYITPYCRIGPYLVGVLLGWIFYKGYKIKQAIIITFCWVLTIITMGLVVYVQYQDVEKYGVLKNSWTTTQRTLYETLSRDAWGLCLAWIVYACNHGYAGFIGHILNWKGWTPLGRMTFAVYLVHPLVIFIYVGNRRDLNYVDNFSVAYMYAGYVLLSYVGGSILSILFEWPAAGLDKIFLGMLKKR